MLDTCSVTILSNMKENLQVTEGSQALEYLSLKFTTPSRGMYSGLMI